MRREKKIKIKKKNKKKKKKKKKKRKKERKEMKKKKVPIVAQRVKNLTSIHHEDVGSIPGLAQCIKDLALL